MKTQRTVATFLAIVVLVVAVNLIMNALMRPGTSNPSQVTSPVYDRVMKTHKIRVGYVTYPPGLIKDPNTHRLSGIFYDTLQEAGKNLGLQIDWTEEVGWGSMIEGLQTDRYDIIGSPVWANTTRGTLADFSVPLFYSGIGIYTRPGDNRFTSNQAAIDSPSVKIATVDGEMSEIIAKSQFPKAQRVSHPQLSDDSQILLDVAQGRADLTFVEPYVADQFLKNNPGSIANITPGKPIRVFPNTMMFGKGDIKFESMMDTALQELVNSGYVDKLLDKYDPSHTFYRVAYPYRLPNAGAQPAGAP